MGKLIRCITSDGAVMASFLDSTDIVKKAEEYHKTSAVVTAALGRLLTATSMMGNMLKGKNDVITLRINGGGPIGNLTAVADSNGDVRGYVTNPIVEIPLKKSGKLDVSTAVGKDGTLFVTKDIGMREPYNGQVQLVSGEIAEDITAYYALSEQIPTVCALGVLINPDLSVNVAGGFILQLLPGYTEEEISRLEENIKNLPAVTVMLQNKMTGEEIIKKALAGFEVEVLYEQETSYKCNCSRARAEKVISSIGREEIEKIIEEQGDAEINCQFCDSKYYFTKEQLEKIANKI